MLKKVKNQLADNRIFFLFLISSATLMIFSIIWVYHIWVLNAPKVYSDGFGYYLYLPATFIYQDYTFSFIEGWEHPFELVRAAGGLVDKYAIGTSILESPFFLSAHFICVIKDFLTGSQSATGYSNLYQYFVLFGGVFYWIIGTFFLYKLLTEYGKFSKKISVCTCLLITYGTNVFHYASYDACFSHVYSYTLFILFLYYLFWYEDPVRHTRNTLFHTCIFGFLAGMIFLVRNTNILFVLTYCLYSVRNFQSLKNRFLEIITPKRAFPIIVTGFITLTPQLLYWHTATGHWFIKSYGDEPFYFLSPEILNFLFSIRKGLFFWSPVLFVALIGMFCSRKKGVLSNMPFDNITVGLNAFLVVIIYVSSAWWSWWYGGSFGCRVSVDFMCVFAIYIAYALTWICHNSNKVLECFLYTYLSLCVIWNVSLMLGYWYHLIPSDETTWSEILQLFQIIC